MKKENYYLIGMDFMAVNEFLYITLPLASVLPNFKPFEAF